MGSHCRLLGGGVDDACRACGGGVECWGCEHTWKKVAASRLSSLLFNRLDVAQGAGGGSANTAMAWHLMSARLGEVANCALHSSVRTAAPKGTLELGNRGLVYRKSRRLPVRELRTEIDKRAEDHEDEARRQSYASLPHYAQLVQSLKADWKCAQKKMPYLRCVWRE